MDSVKTPHIVIAYNGCWYVWNARRPLIRALQEKGYAVTVLAPRDEYTTRLTELGVGFRHIDIDAKGINPLKDIRTLFAYLKAYRELKPDILLQYTIKPNIYGSIAARFLKIPAINNVTGLGTAFERKGILQLVVRGLYRFAFASVERVFFQNRDDRELFLSGGLVKTEQQDLLPGSGVNPDYFQPQPRPEGPFTFLFVGRLLAAKGVEDFVKAARIVRGKEPETRILLVGPYDPADPYSADKGLIDAAVAEGCIELPGPTDEIRNYLAAADCVVLPSRYREGVPRSLLEAASMGKALIAADSIGTREPVADGINGYLCRPGEPEDLAEKMLTLRRLSSRELEQMGRASRQMIIDRFDEKIVINKYLKMVDYISGES